MKTVPVILAAAALLCGCGQKQADVPAPRWEYKVVVAENDAHHQESMYWQQVQTNSQAMDFASLERRGVGDFDFQDKNNLDRLGTEGWELVSAIPQTETMHPPNNDFAIDAIRTGKIILIFKRPAT